MDFSVVIPFHANGDPNREAALDRVVEWLVPHGWPVIVEHAPPDRPWSKGEVVDAGVRRTETPGVVIHDADVLVAHAAVATCATAVTVGHAWAQPHGEVYRLNRKMTRAVIAHQAHGIPNPFLGAGALERRPHPAPPGGGLVVLSRATYDLVGGIDPRFVGWGGEDISFARALDTLAGPAFRMREPMWHLWHEPQPTVLPRRGSADTERLASRYLDAVGNVEQMAEVVRR